ncbi:hypothetical protein Z946_3887 [Sulfitobacter noctilucicola]|nr:hypothetical protein Z946_3887 [Sulfitobacter noctilucicola]
MFFPLSRAFKGASNNIAVVDAEKRKMVRKHHPVLPQILAAS